jgi:hypothetical protein
VADPVRRVLDDAAIAALGRARRDFGLVARLPLGASA